MSIVIIVGRFQTPSIDEHPGYCYMIEEAVKRGSEILFVLGRKETQDKRNILSYFDRSVIITDYMERKYPLTKVHITYLFDCNDNNLWYSGLDNIVYDFGIDRCVLIGSRDSFLDYQWDFKCEIIKLEQFGDFSSSKIREKIMTDDSFDYDVPNFTKNQRNILAKKIYLYLSTNNHESK